MTEFLQTSGFKWIGPKEFNLRKYTGNSCVLEVDLEHPKELHELNNDSPLTLYKTETKREILSDHELQIADLYNIPIVNVKKLVLNFFDKEKYWFHYENLQLHSRLTLKMKFYIAY